MNLIYLTQNNRPIGGSITGLGPIGGEGTAYLGSGYGVALLISRVISNIVGLLTVIAGIYFVFQFIFGAYEWITAGGESQKIQSAQKKMLNGIIGLIIVIAAVFIVDLIGAFLGLDILSPINYIVNIW